LNCTSFQECIVTCKKLEFWAGGIKTFLNNNTQLNANTSPMIPCHSVRIIKNAISEKDNFSYIVQHIIVDVIPPAPVTIISIINNLITYISSRMIHFEMKD